MAKCIVTLVRHGETLANRAGIIQGQSESDLSDLGSEQAAQAGAALAASASTFGKVYCSDLGRTRQTLARMREAAAPTAPEQAFGSPEIVYCRDIREIALGVLEGRPRDTLPSVAAQQHRASGAADRPMESRSDLVRRAVGFWDELQRGVLATAAEGKVGDPGSRPGILVVSHGGFLHALFQDALGITGIESMRNCSISRVRLDVLDSGKVRCAPQSINETAHLESDSKF